MSNKEEKKYFRFGYETPPLWFSLEQLNGKAILLNDLVQRFNSDNDGNFYMISNKEGTSNCFKGDIIYKDDEGELFVYTLKDFLNNSPV